MPRFIPAGSSLRGNTVIKIELFIFSKIDIFKFLKISIFEIFHIFKRKLLIFYLFKFYHCSGTKK